MRFWKLKESEGRAPKDELESYISEDPLGWVWQLFGGAALAAACMATPIVAAAGGLSSGDIGLLLRTIGAAGGARIQDAPNLLAGLLAVVSALVIALNVEERRMPTGDLEELSVRNSIRRRLVDANTFAQVAAFSYAWLATASFTYNLLHSSPDAVPVGLLLVTWVLVAAIATAGSAVRMRRLPSLELGEARDAVEKLSDQVAVLSRGQALELVHPKRRPSSLKAALTFTWRCFLWACLPFFTVSVIVVVYFDQNSGYLPEKVLFLLVFVVLAMFPVPLFCLAGLSRLQGAGRVDLIFMVVISVAVSALPLSAAVGVVLELWPKFFMAPVFVASLVAPGIWAIMSAFWWRNHSNNMIRLVAYQSLRDRLNAETGAPRAP